MKRIVILTDLCTWSNHGMTRYIGPYTTGTRLENAGYDVRIIDWFTLLDLDYIAEFINSDTIAVCLSTTFLNTPVREDPTQLRTRGGTMHEYRNSVLWFRQPEECREWFDHLQRIIDRKAPGAAVILGGTRVSQIYARSEPYIEETFPTVKYAVLGASETTIVPLIRDIEAGRTPYGVTRGGICFVKPLVDQKTCPETTWLPKWGIQPGESLPIEISRGCVYNCKFCHYDKKFSTVRSRASLREEFVRNHDLFGTTQYHFCDDCFNDRLDKVDEVCGTIEELPFQIEWITYARTDLSIKYPETIPRMIRAGARGFFFGIETLNHQAGRAAGKGVPPEKVKNFLLKIRAETDLLVEASFISGLPYETVESQLATYEWIAQNDPFDMFSTAPLGLYDYHPDLDQTIMDYADYSKNPAKYGFEEIRIDPDRAVYWRHAGMDLYQARELNTIGVRRWRENHPNQELKSFWWYPSYRSLGITHDEILGMVRGTHNSDLRQKIIDRWNKRFNMYQYDLLAHLF